MVNNKEKMKNFCGFQPECFLCWVRRSFEAVEALSGNRILQMSFMKKVVKHLMECQQGYFDPEFVIWFFRYLSEITRIEDPYAKIKEEYSRKALSLYPNLKKIVKNAEDPILTAAIIASGANIIDEAGGLEFDLEESLHSAVAAGFTIDDYPTFLEQLVKSRRILYIADNAGEIVFDRLFLEQIENIEITFVVRGCPLGTDATTLDAKFAGIENIAKLISSEKNRPLRIVESKVKALSKALNETDMIICKGMLNFEVLSFQLRQPAFYLFKIKCNNVRESLVSKGNPEIGDLVLLHQ